MLSGQLNKHNFQIVFKVQAGAHKALNPDRLRRLLRERVGQKKGRLTSGQIARDTHTHTEKHPLELQPTKSATFRGSKA